MAEIVRMPRLSDTMTEGVIVGWHKKKGDKVSAGDILADVETDKATMELEAYVDGTLLHVGVSAGDAVPIDVIIAIIGEEGEDVQSILDAETSSSTVEVSEAEAKEEVSPEPAPVVSPPAESTATPVSSSVSQEDSDSRLKASPLAKKMAREAHINLASVQGSGDEGRIIKKDIEAYMENGFGASSRPVINMKESHKDTKVSQMRKTIARRLAESKFSAPHFYLNISVRMDAADAARKSIHEMTGVKISFNDLVVKATAYALKLNPSVNSSWLGDVIRQYDHVHIGVAVAMDEGLIVPVIRHADAKGLTDIAQEVRELAGKAKNKELQPKDWEGNTFTISNLGMFGIDSFTAIVNPPDACILAVGGVNEEVVADNGTMKIAKVMRMTLSCDHRVVDGAMGAAFLKSLKSFLEDPIRLLAFNGVV